MKIHYDKEADAVYIEFNTLEAGTAENRELSDNIIANYAPDGRLAGLEILGAHSLIGEGLKEITV